MRVPAIFLLPLALAGSITLHHRVLPPLQSPSLAGGAAAEPEWIPLGDVDTASSAFTSAASGGSARVDLRAHQTQADPEGTWYQVGWEGEDGWVFASTRACLLTAQPHIVLHIPTDSPLSSISLHLPVPPSGSGQCPPTPPSASYLTSPKIEIRRPTKILGPQSAAPAPPTPTNPSTGLPQAPEPEKSFLQKYWMPLLGLGVFLVGQMASPEKGQAQQGGARGR